MSKLGVCLLSIIITISVFSIVAFANDDVIAYEGNMVTVNKTCEGSQIKFQLKNVNSEDGQSGFLIFSSELLSNSGSFDHIEITVNRAADSSVFKFSSSTLAQGLFATTTHYTGDAVKEIVTEGNATKSSSIDAIAVDAKSISLIPYIISNDATGSLFTCVFPINPLYRTDKPDYADWREGIEGALTISCRLMSGTNNTVVGEFTTDVFDLPAAAVDDSGDSPLVSSPTVTGTLIPEKTEAYNCGDTVKVTATLTPDAAAKLSAGSLKFSYDTEKLTFTGAVVNEALKEGQATLYENTLGTCVASFKGDPLDVTTEGLVLAEFSFEAVRDGTADFGIIEAVAADEKASACTTQTGDPLSVTINALPKVTTADFGSDYKMVKYVADALPGEGNAYFIGDTALTYIPAYATGDNAGKYIFVMLSKDEPVDQIVTTKVGSYGTVTATGDANGDTQTNIIDAQVVYYMTTSKITSSDSGYDWLNSDVNGSGTLDALDAHAIQYFVHYGQFGQFSS